jgi:hypothetical protein
MNRIIQISDSDSYLVAAGDYNDNNVEISPGPPEKPGVGINNNCVDLLGEP